MDSIIHNFSTLSDYEVGRCIDAIKTIGRGTKPVAEVCNVKPENLDLLKEDIRNCLRIAGEPEVKGFLLRQEGERWSYGFYREAWVEEALLFIDSVELPAFHRHWISGLLFGYCPEAIQRFLNGVSVAQGASEPLDDTLSRGETFLPCSRQSHTHSMASDRFLTVS